MNLKVSDQVKAEVMQYDPHFQYICQTFARIGVSIRGCVISSKTHVTILCPCICGMEETVLQDMADKLIKIGGCYGMEINVEKQK